MLSRTKDTEYVKVVYALVTAVYTDSESIMRPSCSEWVAKVHAWGKIKDPPSMSNITYWMSLEKLAVVVVDIEIYLADQSWKKRVAFKFLFHAIIYTTCTPRSNLYSSLHSYSFSTGWIFPISWARSSRCLWIWPSHLGMAGPKANTKYFVPCSQHTDILGAEDHRTG